ncbi:MAG: DUF2085 domain-containing protein [Bryobacterales bacterium]
MIPSIRLGLATLALLALSAATLAPIAAAHGRAEAVGLYIALRPLCHQRPERSWSYRELPVGLCIRCYGLHAGIFAAALLGLPFRPRLAAAGVAALGSIWAVEHLGGADVSQLARFASGCGFGLALTSLGSYSQKNRPKPSPTMPRRIL